MQQRLITAVIMLAVVLASIYLLPDVWFQLLTAAMVLWAGYEWIALHPDVKPGLQRGCFLILLALGMYVLQHFGWQYAIWLQTLTAACWLFAVVVVIIFARGGAWLLQSRLLYWLCGILFMLAAYQAIILLRSTPQAATGLLIMLAPVWLMDTGAYLAGCIMGRTALAKRVSPGKTWEGVAGGAVLLCCYLGLLYATNDLFQQRPWVLFGLLAIGLFSIFGDLLESACKRVATVKDSGSLLPGHGGILDRIDGLLAALPWLALLTLYTYK